MTLLEVAIAAGILALLAAAGLAFAQGGRPFAGASAAQEFDAALAYAQAVAAASGNGATLVFTRRSAPDGTALPGFTLRIYAGRPTGSAAMEAAKTAPLTSSGTVTEARLGGVPFTVFLDSAGHASAVAGAATSGTAMAADPGCPAGASSVVLTLHDGRSTRTRTLACNSAVAGAPVSIGTVPP